MIKQRQFNWRLVWGRRKYLVLAGLLFFSSALIVFFGVWSQINQVLALNTQITKLKPKQVALQRKAITLEEIQSSPEFQQLSVVETALPSKKPLLELLTSLNKMAAQSEVSVVSFEIEPGSIATESAATAKARQAKRQGDTDFLELTFFLSGTIDQIRQFTRLVEQMTPFTLITSFQITNERPSAGSNRNQAIIVAEITTHTYFYVGQVTSKVDTALPVIAARDKEVLSTVRDFQGTLLPAQSTIDGGLEDLFGVEALQFGGAVNRLPLATPTPIPTQTPLAPQPAPSPDTVQ